VLEGEETNVRVGLQLVIYVATVVFGAGITVASVNSAKAETLELKQRVSALEQQMKLLERIDERTLAIQKQLETRAY
jgi:hypothetical protein